MSDVDDLLKLQKLLNDGLITREEFDLKKEKILGTNSDEDKNHTPAENTPDSTHSSNDRPAWDRIFAILFSIVLWPIGFIYTLVKKPFSKTVNIILCIWNAGVTLIAIAALISAIHDVRTAQAQLAAQNVQTQEIAQAVSDAAAAGNAAAAENTADAGNAAAAGEQSTSAEADYAPQTVSDVQPSSADVSYEEFVSALRAKLSSAYGDNCIVTDDGKILTISIWQDGIAQEAAYVLRGTAGSSDVWDQFKNSLQTLAVSSFNAANSAAPERHVCLNILNDENTDNVLLSYLDGECIYDAVEAAREASVK